MHYDARVRRIMNRSTLDAEMGGTLVVGVFEPCAGVGLGMGALHSGAIEGCCSYRY